MGFTAQRAICKRRPTSVGRWRGFPHVGHSSRRPAAGSAPRCEGAPRAISRRDSAGASAGGTPSSFSRAFLGQGMRDRTHRRREQGRQRRHTTNTTGRDRREPNRTERPTGAQTRARAHASPSHQGDDIGTGAVTRHDAKERIHDDNARPEPDHHGRRSTGTHAA